MAYLQRMSHDCCFILRSDFQAELYTELYFLSPLYCYGEVDSNSDSTASHGANHWQAEGDGCVQSGMGFVRFQTSSLCCWSPLRGPLPSPVELCLISSLLGDTFFSFRLAWVLIRVCKQYFSSPLLQCMVVCPSPSVTYVAVLSAREVISVALDKKEPCILGNGETRGHSSCWQRG